MAQVTRTKLYAIEPQTTTTMDDATAKAWKKGGAAAGEIDVAPGIKLYQISESGLVLKATIQGTKY